MAKKFSPQPEVNIGLIGHVDHGKTTLVKALSGKWADTHSEEVKRGITIRLGYADVEVYKIKGKKGPDAFTIDKKAKGAEPLRKYSLVDAPGHESLMATMLSGANIMDGAILLVAANEKCPQAQTMEHVQALEIIGIDNVIVVQNKVDIVTPEQAKAHYESVKDFLKKTKYKDAPVIPMSAVHQLNLDVLLQTVEDIIPTPKRDEKTDPLMFVARSFDINKPGTIPEELQGGVLGGVLKQGVLKEGQELEILPGIHVESKGFLTLTTKAHGIHTGSAAVKSVAPGGSFAVMTGLDPAIVKSDQLVGCLVGKTGTLPQVWDRFTLDIHLLERVVGAKDDLVVEPLKKSEVFMLNVNSAATVGMIIELKKDAAVFKLKRPVCAAPGSRVTLSRRVGQRWRLVGYGLIKK